MIIPGKHQNRPARARPVFAVAIAAAFAAALVDGFAGPAGATEVSVASCEVDHEELLKSIQRNRRDGVDEINAVLKGADDPDERRHLAAQREKIWDEEERQRTVAFGIRRDCLAAAK